ncbi:MAG: T9SS type A sorting domain-containing protein [Bacteroidales bacterium]|nr:T9SS type A sorting domain-containing protein [Bacteroidales bacterium]
MKKISTKMICIAFITVLCAGNVLAQEKECNVFLLSHPIEGGTVVGDGTYLEGESVVVSAVPDVIYKFVNWTEDGIEVSADAAYTFIVRGDRHLVANFVKASSSIELTLSATPPDGGEVFGDGTYSYGESATIKATPHDGWEFINWVDYEYGYVVSAEPEYTFTINSPRTLTANFAAIPGPFDVVLRCDPPEGGAVSGGGTYSFGEEVTITAKPNEEYVFLYWADTEYGYHTEATPEFTFTAFKNLDWTAHFTTSGKGVTVLVNMPGGEVVGGGTYHYGDEVTVEAIPHSGYVFVSWTKGREILSADNPYRFTVTEDLVLIANFAEEGVLPIETIDGGEIMIYPNPTDGEIQVTSYELQVTSIEIFDVMGKKQKAEGRRQNETLNSINISNLPIGVYFLKIQTENGVVVRKVVKN